MDNTSKIDAFFRLMLLLFLPWMLYGMYKEINNVLSYQPEHTQEVYQLQKISSLDDKVEITNKENNSLIGQFFLGKTEKSKKEKEKVISLQYAVQSKDGIQLKDFKKEYKRDVFSDDVFFKESANAQAKLTVTYVGFSIDKIIFALPKEDLEQILSRLQD